MRVTSDQMRWVIERDRMKTEREKESKRLEKKTLPLSLNFVHPQAHRPWSAYQLTQTKCFFSFFFYKPWKRSLYVMYFYFCAVTIHREVGMKTHLNARFSLDTGLKSNYMGFDKPFFVPYKNPNLLTGALTWYVCVKWYGKVFLFWSYLYHQRGGCTRGELSQQ